MGFDVPRDAEVELAVFDIQGRQVTVLARGPHLPGRYQLVWDGRIEGGQAASGLYFVRFQAPGRAFVRRLVLLR